MKKKILARMKPKVQSLGFKEEDLESAVEGLAGDLPEDATDEDIDAAIDKVMPFLKVSQKAATRMVNAEKEKLNTPPKESKESKEESKSESKSPEEPSANDKLLQKLEELEKKISGMESAETNKHRTSRLVSRFKEKSIDEDFYAEALEGRSFDNDEDAETFASRIESRWETYSQKLANEGLSRMSKPAGGGSSKKEDVAAEVKARAERNQKEAESAAPAISGLSN